MSVEVRGLLFGFPGTVLCVAPPPSKREKPVIAAQRLSALVVDALEPRRLPLRAQMYQIQHPTGERVQSPAAGLPASPRAFPNPKEKLPFPCGSLTYSDSSCHFCKWWFKCT